MTADHAEHLADSVEDLNQEVRVLRDAIDELRETLQWISQNNGVEQTYSILKAMGRNVNDPDWSNHLQIETGVSAIVAQRTAQSKSENTIRPLIEKLLSSPELCENPTPHTRDTLAELTERLNLEPPPTKQPQTSDAPKGDSLF